MKATNELLKQIQQFHFNHDRPVLSFTKRLARENGWTRDYADRVIEEYKKFMYLAVAAGHPVTPSEQVDQVWHLHLVYTRSYWQDFCGPVLGKPVHHSPTQGGHEKQAKYRDWYERTKASYARLLFEAPPDDIWPHADLRFGEDLQWRLVNTRHNWILAKSRVRYGVLAGLGVLLIVIAFWLTGRPSQFTSPTVISETVRNSRSVQTMNPLAGDRVLPFSALGAQSMPPLRRTNRDEQDRTPVFQDLQSQPRGVGDSFRWSDQHREVRERTTRNASSGGGLIAVLALQLVFACVLLVSILYSLFFRYRCPSCGKFQRWRKLVSRKVEQGGWPRPNTSGSVSTAARRNGQRTVLAPAAVAATVGAVAVEAAARALCRQERFAEQCGVQCSHPFKMCGQTATHRRTLFHKRLERAFVHHDTW